MNTISTAGQNEPAMNALSTTRQSEPATNTIGTARSEPAMNTASMAHSEPALNAPRTARSEPAMNTPRTARWTQPAMNALNSSRWTQPAKNAFSMADGPSRRGVFPILICIWLAGCAKAEWPPAIDWPDVDWPDVDWPDVDWPWDGNASGGPQGAEATRIRVAVQQTLETKVSDETTSYVDETSGTAVAVTPLSTFKTSTGYFCRRYRLTVISETRGRKSVERTACRNDDGIWTDVRL